MYANASNAMQMIAKITDNDYDNDNENDFYKNEKKKKKLLLGRSKEKNHFSLTLAPTTLKIFPPVCSLGVQHPRPCRVRSCA